MKKIDLDKLIHSKSTAWRRYHEKIRIKSVPTNELQPYDWPESWKKIYFKSYPRFDEVPLPKPQLRTKSLEVSLRERKSTRAFSSRKLSIQQISTLLYYSAGISPDRKDRRFYPSGGYRYPVEIYLLSLNSQLKKGIYHYYVPNHSLERIFENKKFEIKKTFTPFNLTWISQASVIIVMTAVIGRSYIKYGDRAYKFIHLEAGHIGQNMYLISSALGMGCCAIGGQVDSYIAKTLDLDETHEPIIYSMAVGNKNS